MRAFIVTLLALAGMLLMASAQVSVPTEPTDKQVRIQDRLRFVWI